MQRECKVAMKSEESREKRFPSGQGVRELFGRSQGSVRKMSGSCLEALRDLFGRCQGAV
ncbi:UNVERIFIED_CONTAM: hypothetical protein Slati_0965200 [Sesamum latifolium]|uniref:Uncharacterized protein n=1 Tax=Sesamum latifolium TaxID=2727402 RepID=A0AAW2XRU4_9LAMI